jgi:TetR/AcrR family transcriptional regulator, tetracycline repressor protein
MSTCPPHLAARCYATLARYAPGLAIQLDKDDSALRLDEAQPSASSRELDPSLFPATVAVAGSLPVPIEEEFAFGLELIVNGLGQLRDDT